MTPRERFEATFPPRDGWRGVLFPSDKGGWTVRLRHGDNNVFSVAVLADSTEDAAMAACCDAWDAATKGLRLSAAKAALEYAASVADAEVEGCRLDFAEAGMAKPACERCWGAEDVGRRIRALATPEDALKGDAAPIVRINHPYEFDPEPEHAEDERRELRIEFKLRERVARLEAALADEQKHADRLYDTMRLAERHPESNLASETLSEDKWGGWIHAGTFDESIEIHSERRAALRKDDHDA